MSRTTPLTIASAVLAAVLATSTLAAQTPTPPPAGTPPGPPPMGMRHRGPMMGGPRGGSVDERVQRLSGELNLTPEQTARVKALFTSEQRSADSIRAVRALQMETERKAMDARREAHEKALQAILTPEQKAKHEALMKQHEGRGGRGRGHDGPPDHRGRGDDNGRRR